MSAPAFLFAMRLRANLPRQRRHCVNPVGWSRLPLLRSRLFQVLEVVKLIQPNRDAK